MKSEANIWEYKLGGALLGTAIGDAIGLAREGLAPDRAQRMFGALSGHELFLKKGLVSDDTEHTCMVLQSLIESADNTDTFLSSFAKRLQGWLLLLRGGVGKATLRSVTKLNMGYSHHKSGVFSAGNGPAMRSTIIGVYYSDDPQKMKDTVYGASLITHTDPRAYLGALVIAHAAAMASKQAITNPQAFYKSCVELLQKETTQELIDLIKQAVDSVEKNEPTALFAKHIGLEQGVSGYVYHTVPVVIQAWLSHQADYEAAVKSVIACGGDCDSTAAIVGGIVGSHVGEIGMPEPWLKNLIEWPRSVTWMRSLARQASRVKQEQTVEKAIRTRIVLQLIRNILFMGIVLMHGIRRLFPPY